MPNLIKKIYAHSFGRFIYRPIFQPKTVFLDLESYVNSEVLVPGDAYQEIFPAFRADEKHLEVFGSDFPEYIEKSMFKEGHRTVIARLKNGRIDTDKGASIAVFNQNNALLGEVTFSFKDATEDKPRRFVGPEENNIFTRSYILPPKKVKGTVFSLLSGGGAVRGYYHWFVDVLPRMHVLEKSGWKDEIDYYLVPNTEFGFQKELLALAGIPEAKIIDGKKFPHVKADTLIVTSHPRTPTHYVPQWMADYMHDFLASFAKDAADKQFPKRLYLTRRDALIRRVLNDEQVEALLAGFGFKPVVFSELSFAEKAKMLGEAEIIVSPHGAGLSNLFMLNDNAHVIELFPDKFLNSAFFQIIRRTAKQYHYLKGLAIHDREVKDSYTGLHEDIMVDLKALEELINSIVTSEAYHKRSVMLRSKP